jgi:hypothetical protein
MIFMQSMKRRLAGEVPVSPTVRFADVPTQKKASSQVRGAGTAVSPAATAAVPRHGPAASLIGWCTTCPSRPQGKAAVARGGPGGIAFQTPRKEVATQQSLVFGALAVWGIVQVRACVRGCSRAAAGRCSAC